MEITYTYINELGDRLRQEDTVGTCVYDEKAVFAVADGLGGHGMGDIASTQIIEKVLRIFRKNMGIESYFSEVFTDGNKMLCELQEQYHILNGIKTTLACIVIKEDAIYGAYIGDSRIYIFEKNRIVFRTLDHSLPQMLANIGEISEKDIRNHPDRSKLLKVLGDQNRDVFPQIIEKYYIQDNTRVLVCSDGFWENILENEMEKTLRKSKNSNEWMSRMKKIVERRSKLKKQDNYSAICVDIRKN